MTASDDHLLLQSLESVESLSDAAIVTELVEILGPRITAMAAGIGETPAVRRWMIGEAVPERRDNLIAALRATRAIVARSGPAAAQRWFLGTNSFFAFESPVLALQQNTDEVRSTLVRAALAFAW
jgi:hypothetical protein